MAPELTLALWERSVGRPVAERDAVLLGWAPSSLAVRNTLALQRYAAWFGPAVELVGRCPHCSASVEFSIDTAHCAQALPDDAARQDWHEWSDGVDTLRFRLPQPADLQALHWVDDATEFAQRLLDRCVEGGAPDSAIACDALSQAMESLIPGANLCFSLQCPDCTTGWEAPLDPVALLWRELRQRAERLLGDVALLARHLGWSEAEILALSPTRRAAYLQLVTA